MTNRRRRFLHFAPALSLSIALALAPGSLVFAQTGIVAPLSPAADALALPDAPVPQQNNPQPQQQGAIATATAAVQSISPHNRVVQPGQTVHPLSNGQKAIFSLRESANPINLATSLYSAGYEQLTGGDPKYGSNGDAFASRFGASMAHTVSMRIFSDGVLATVLHQDPRYYRIGEGSIWTRSLRSAEQALVRHSDNGVQEIDSSGLAGRAAAAVLTLAYYPPASRKAGVVLSTFGVSVATDAGGDLVLEFFPDIARKFPILKKIEIQ